MTTEDAQVGPIEVRTVPRMRVARAIARVEPAALWGLVEAVAAAARGTGVAVAGVPIVVFGERAPAVDGATAVEVEIRVPVSDLRPPLPADGDGPAVDFVRLDRLRAACVTYAGPARGLADAVRALLVWVERSGLRRAGAALHHVYMPNAEPRAITVEIRVPLD